VSPRRLPLFPLPLVLFPGVPLPLHIFEPRYRRMLADCLEGDRRFGIVFRPDGTAEDELPAGHVGCVAQIESSQVLPDGRSNVVVIGIERFALVRFVSTPQPYHVGEVTEYEDEREPASVLEPLAERLRELFARVGRAARTLADDRDPLPVLPPEPGLLSFTIASLVDIDAPARQRLLASRSPSARLRELDTLLASAVEPLEQRARVHAGAKGNGHGPYTGNSRGDDAHEEG
jgi:ATP-dependent Lon protease